MSISPTCRLAAYLAIALSLAQIAFASDILIGDAKSQPESLTIAPGGILIVGSASAPFVYKVRPGSATAEKFIDASGEAAGTFFFGMLADASSNTLWTCQLTPVPDAKPARHHTALRGFDLATGAAKLRWDLPGDNSTCNDFAIGPDGMRAANGKIFVAENGSGKISALTINGDKASVTVLKEGLKTPTGVEPAGDTLWIAERGAGRAVSIPMPK